MKNIKYITSLVLSAVLALSMAGCGGSGSADIKSTAAGSSSAAVTEDIANRDDLGTVYTYTAIFSVPKPAIENQTPSSTSAVIYPDITDCGQLNTFSGQYSIPEIKAEEDVEYFSPIICDKEVSSVTFARVPEDSGNPDYDGKGAVAETTIKVGDKEVKGFLLKEQGTYKVTIGEESMEITAKSSSLYLDIINEIVVPNILVNTSSTDYSERAKEYDVNVPALVRGYMDKFKDEDKTLAALKMDNGLYLKEYNRIRVLRGDKILSAEDMVEAYKDTNIDEKKIKLSPNRRGMKEKVATLCNITLTPEEKKTPGDNQNNSSNSTVPSSSSNNNSSSSSSSTNSSTTPSSSKNNTASNNTATTSGGGGTGTGAEALALVNEYRAQYGLAPFAWGDGNVAAIRAQEIVSNFSHYSASGQQCYGENICMAPNGTARQAVNQWIESPPHRQNLLDPVCTRCAIAVVYSGGYWWWSMNMWK